MTIPLQITFRDIETSPAIDNRIRECAEKLERVGARITSCHVVVTEPHRHHRKGEAINVRIDLKVPGDEIVVNREPAANTEHADIYVAIRDAFDAARRQLEDSLRRRRGEVKTHEQPNGRISG
jgi:ribosomal subunit interface protein